jgi:type IV secretory pathway VirB6-like protein
MMGVKRFNIGLNSNQNQNQQRQNESEKLNENENVEFKVTDDVVVNVVNPLMQDTNYYYQSSNSNVDPKATAQLRLFVAPHGAPSTNPNWTSQFKNL